MSEDLQHRYQIMKRRDQFDPLTYKINGAAMNVHNKLGTGFAEIVYADALAIEFTKQGIPYEREKEILIFYDNIPLPHKFRTDFICYGNIIVELKATKDIAKEHEAQLLNYLKATRYRCGLILNFGKERLEKARFFN